MGFRYPGAERWAVRGLTFELRAGETLALVGENGAGKTTLVKLLARLYDPDEGRILLDGHDLREYDLFALRANIGVIFQDFVRYHFTAADNIAVGRIEARDDRARIVEAAERSLADEVIRKLPNGYDQVLGKRFRTGVDLSGGEWQKVAIARAYMRDAQLLILDEPTAALDARSEFEVFKRFKELSEGKTAVLISHRFSSVRMADRIVVLDGRRGRCDRARTPNCWRRAGATRNCSSCRRRGIGSARPLAPSSSPQSSFRRTASRHCATGCAFWQRSWHADPDHASFLLFRPPDLRVAVPAGLHGDRPPVAIRSDGQDATAREASHSSQRRSRRAGDDRGLGRAPRQTRGSPRPLTVIVAPGANESCARCVAPRNT